MTPTWLIEPRDGLAFRDGRPNDGRSQSRCLPFPMPQTVAGAVRTRIGLRVDGSFGLTTDEAKSIVLEGPFLARIGSGTPELLLPAPGDALWFEDPDSKAKEILRLVPLEKDSVFRGGHVPHEDWNHMWAVGLPESRDGKPPKGTPAFWQWPHLEAWLLGKIPKPSDVLHGEKPLEQDRRMHVAIDPATGTYVEGALFGVSSLVFRSRVEGDGLGKIQELALAFRCGHPSLTEGLGFLGGKNQLAVYRKTDEAIWPTCPGALLTKVQKGTDPARIRLMLATPGVFRAGWRPARLLESGAPLGIRIELKAAKVDRPLTLSGWDYEKQQTKRTRRAVPAGAVYWLELHGEGSARAQWLLDHWMKPVSDEDQDCRDGCGLALMGVWA